MEWIHTNKDLENFVDITYESYNPTCLQVQVHEPGNETVILTTNEWAYCLTTIFDSKDGAVGEELYDPAVEDSNQD